MTNTAKKNPIQSPSATAVIPARYASTRFPGKPLIDLCGKPMIQRVYEQAAKARLVGRVLVATDDQRIFDTVRDFGGECLLTDPNHPTGTDRLAEVAAQVTDSILVNVQGDEPLIAPDTIDAAVRPLIEDATIVMATTREPLPRAGDAWNPNIVKVVCDREDFALYFSRAPIPWMRDTPPTGPNDDSEHPGIWWKHTGLYAYRRDFLLAFAKLEPAPLERIEALEQLRALHHGFRIKVVPISAPSPGVDTPEDAERVRTILTSIENRE